MLPCQCYAVGLVNQSFWWGLSNLAWTVTDLSRLIRAIHPYYGLSDHILSILLASIFACQNPNKISKISKNNRIKHIFPKENVICIYWTHNVDIDKSSPRTSYLSSLLVVEDLVIMTSYGNTTCFSKKRHLILLNHIPTVIVHHMPL